MPTMLEHTANRFMEILGDGWKLSGNATYKQIAKGKRYFVLTHSLDTRLQIVNCVFAKQSLKLMVK
jgi:hypothetical protein